ncbi:flagellar basal-body MS-ring/collar protein FliF [Desulfitobacterium hafniense]|uniref:flagellar basal-body MS-ring/collar protein FliF n=1 Tax=Desulfitobacterium hafniense TaxID=49338 RepID=UPI000A880969|nr:flagellar basal-body MS-ring/collar protein FliF [Desulfitobacterium hafniense]
MNFSWAEIKQSILEFWGKLSRPQKVITVAAPLAVAIALISLLYWASNPSYVAILTDLTDIQAGEITSQLDELKVKYKLGSNGSSILVPEKEAAAIRLKLANEGLPKGSEFSWSESLNKTRVGETESDRRLRYNLGLQTELETTLKTLSNVKDARVHLNIPEETLFIEQQEATTAAVTLTLKEGSSITEDQIRGIANLLAASVKGLKLEDVTILDSDGNTLSDVLSEDNQPGKMTATQIQLKQLTEENTRKSVQSMLDKAFGAGKTIVRTNATLNFDQVTTDTVTHGPGAVLSESHTTENTTNTSPGGTAPGVDTNVPGYLAPDGTGITSSSEKTSDTLNHQVDTTQEQRIKSPGDIARLSVSVLLDADSISADQIEQIEAIVASAAGIDRDRGDQIQVAALPFDKTGALEQEQALAEAARKERLRTYIEWGVGALLALVFLFVLFRMRSKRKQDAESLELGQVLQPVPLAATEELLLAQQEAEKEVELKLAQQKQKSAEEIQRQKIKESVDIYVQNNPDEVARLVKTWLAEEK